MKIIKVKKHLLVGDTDVSLEAPEFENFGKRFEEMERLADEANPIDPEEVAASTAKMMAHTQAMQEEARKELEAMPDGPKKEMRKMMMGMLDKMSETAAQAQEQAAGPDADEKDEEESEPEEQQQVQRNPHALQLSVPKGIKWNAQTQALLEQFFADWPNLRPVVLQAVFDYYKKIYPELADSYDYHKGRQFIVPQPTSPEAIEDIFYVQSLYLHPDGAIGISGHCTWDEEHGFGLRLKNGKVVAVGPADVAF